MYERLVSHSLARPLEGRERVEDEHREVGERPRDLGRLPERLVGRLGHRVDHRDQSELADALHVAADPWAVHRHALESRVEADAHDPELTRTPVELGQTRVLEDRLDQPDRHGESVGLRVAVRGDARVEVARVGDAVRARVRVAGDHRGLPHAAGVHDPDPLGPLGVERGSLGRRVLLARARHERPHVTHVVVAVEDVEAVNVRHVRTLEPMTGVASGP